MKTEKKYDEKELKELFGQYTLLSIVEFQSLFLPLPITTENITFKIKTSDGYDTCVWGTNKKEILCHFNKYLNLRIFI